MELGAAHDGTPREELRTALLATEEVATLNIV